MKHGVTKQFLLASSILGLIVLGLSLIQFTNYKFFGFICYFVGGLSVYYLSYGFLKYKELCNAKN